MSEHLQGPYANQKAPISEWLIALLVVMVIGFVAPWVIFGALRVWAEAYRFFCNGRCY